MLDLNRPSTVKLKRLLDSLPDHNLPDLFSSILRASFEEKLEVLDAVELSERFKVARPLLLRQIAVREATVGDEEDEGWKGSSKLA